MSVAKSRQSKTWKGNLRPKNCDWSWWWGECMVNTDFAKI